MRLHGLTCNTTPPVIPAKAGIHGEADSTNSLWIPAFAGMTRKVFLGIGGNHPHMTASGNFIPSGKEPIYPCAAASCSGTKNRSESITGAK